MLSAKHALSQAEKEENAARNDEKSQAKAVKVAREFGKGSELLKELERFCNPKLNNLTLPELNC